MNNEHLTKCLIVICDPESAKNPVAWFDLEQAGITRESLREQVDRGEWHGPTPVFDAAPDREGVMWQYLSSEKETQQCK
jgi:hypothetical protein